MPRDFFCSTWSGIHCPGGITRFTVTWRARYSHRIKRGWEHRFFLQLVEVDAWRKLDQRKAFGGDIQDA